MRISEYNDVVRTDSVVVCPECQTNLEEIKRNSWVICSGCNHVLRRVDNTLYVSTVGEEAARNQPRLNGKKTEAFEKSPWEWEKENMEGQIMQLQDTVDGLREMLTPWIKLGRKLRKLATAMEDFLPDEGFLEETEDLHTEPKER